MRMQFAAGVVAAVLLVACGAPSKPAADAPSTPLPSTSAASSVAVPSKGDKPNREFLIGKWGTNGDCELAIDLRADGTSDGPFGNWTYQDGAIGFVDEPDFKVNVTVIDDTTMESTNGGKVSKMTRCP